jgi:hypothetical protein
MALRRSPLGKVAGFTSVTQASRAARNRARCSGEISVRAPGPAAGGVEGVWASAEQASKAEAAIPIAILFMTAPMGILIWPSVPHDTGQLKSV